MNTTERFFKHVSKTDTCWLWMGAKRGGGYGEFRIGSYKDGTRKMVVAHRFSWELHNGAIPKEMQVCHNCDVRNCVNPDHLFLGTQVDNMQDMHSKGRHPFMKTHCVHGHEFTIENTLYGTQENGNTRRFCRICNNERQKKHRRGRHG